MEFSNGPSVHLQSPYVLATGVSNATGSLGASVGATTGVSVGTSSVAVSVGTSVGISGDAVSVGASTVGSGVSVGTSTVGSGVPVGSAVAVTLGDGVGASAASTPIAIRTLVP